MQQLDGAPYMEAVDHDLLLSGGVSKADSNSIEGEEAQSNLKRDAWGERGVGKQSSRGTALQEVESCEVPGHLSFWLSGGSVVRFIFKALPDPSRCARAQNGNMIYA